MNNQVELEGFTTPPQQMAVTRDMFLEQLERVRSSVVNPEQGLFGPHSMMWRIGSRALIGAHGSGRALMLQIAHPWVTRGIDEHSETRADPLARGARTFIAVLSIVYGSLDQAIRESKVVHRVHTRIHGNLPYDAGAFSQGSHYQANEAHAMLWVHATLWETSICMYELFVGPLSAAEKESYYQETKLFAYMFGIPDEILPPNWNEFIEYNQKMWNSDLLAVNEETKTLAGFLFSPLHPTLTFPTAWLKLVTAGSLPTAVREKYGFRFNSNDEKWFQRGVKTVSFFEPATPKIIRNGPSFIEANRRIAGKGSTFLTRKMQKLMLGRDELVALER